MEGFLEKKEDGRGYLVEFIKIPGIGQCYYSVSKPGAVRGNHYHTRKIEHFCVIEGEGLVRLRNRTNGEIKEYQVSGEKPQVVAMAVNWTHNIKNIGVGEMKLLIWANEVFDPANPDTFAEEV